MFKTRHIIFFSLIPLALVFTGVIIGSIHGSDSELEVLPTLSALPTEAPPPEGANVIPLVAQNLKFDKGSLSAPAGEEVTVRFQNQDAGVLHNFSLYTNRQATTRIYVGDVVPGVIAINDTFTAPRAGTYYFRCDVHPDMNGTFITK